MAIISNKVEQENLKHSGRILASCLFHLKNELKPGLNGEDINNFTRKFIESKGAFPCFIGYLGFPHAICLSINNEVVHGLSLKSKVLKAGDIVSLDLGVEYKGMYTDSAITFILTETGVDPETDFFGKTFEDVKNSKFNNIEEKLFSANQKTASFEDKQKFLYHSFESLWAGISCLKGGVKVGDIGFYVNQVLERNKIGNVLALGGHGVGRSVHEPPYIPHRGKKGEGKRIVENMVIAIEPLTTMGPSGKVNFVTDPKYSWDEVVSVDNSLASHFEHTIMVQKKGFEVITLISKENVIPIA